MKLYKEGTKKRKEILILNKKEENKMYTILMYVIVSFGSFWIGFLLCAILTNSKNREYQENKIIEKRRGNKWN